VKDVVAGEAHYKGRYPSITFRKVCITNQAFNPTAHMHAAKNEVVLLDQQKLITLLQDYPVTMTEVEQLLYPKWESETA
jgi:Restriction endonuclease